MKVKDWSCFALYADTKNVFVYLLEGKIFSEVLKERGLKWGGVKNGDYCIKSSQQLKQWINLISLFYWYHKGFAIFIKNKKNSRSPKKGVLNKGITVFIKSTHKGK